MNNLISLLINEINAQNLWENRLTIKRNEYLNKKGIINSNLYFIKKGTFRIYTVDGETEYTIRFGYQNNMITAIDSFITNQPSQFYIQALKESQVYSISKQRFKCLIEEKKEYQQAYEAILEQLILQQMEREMDLLIANPKERYERVLKRSPLLFQEIPLKYIASYLRMAPETLSRM
ncbi:MAG: Crp/Fnr family transcriptional regulator [Flavobacteriales bacterium]|jgi:CRP-like cAMP-binding protein|nr:Crp/Fnr family transcriptional regulator [Flavobacteriales bacterium]